VDNKMEQHNVLAQHIAESKADAYELLVELKAQNFSFTNSEVFPELRNMVTQFSDIMIELSKHDCEINIRHEQALYSEELENYLNPVQEVLPETNWLRKLVGLQAVVSPKITLVIGDTKVSDLIAVSQWEGFTKYVNQQVSIIVHEGKVITVAFHINL
jgi:predicted CopG family antitoxin